MAFIHKTLINTRQSFLCAGARSHFVCVTMIVHVGSVEKTFCLRHSCKLATMMIMMIRSHFIYYSIVGIIWHMYLYIFVYLHGFLSNRFKYSFVHKIRISDHTTEITRDSDPQELNANSHKTHRSRQSLSRWQINYLESLKMFYTVY